MGSLVDCEQRLSVDFEDFDAFDFWIKVFPEAILKLPFGFLVSIRDDEKDERGILRDAYRGAGKIFLKIEYPKGKFKDIVVEKRHTVYTDERLKGFLEAVTQGAANETQ